MVEKTRFSYKKGLSTKVKVKSVELLIISREYFVQANIGNQPESLSDICKQICNIGYWKFLFSIYSNTDVSVGQTL